MKIFLICCAALCVAACSPVGGANGGPVLQGNSAVVAAKTEYGFEAVYSFSATLYLKYEAQLPPAKHAQAKAALQALLNCDAAGHCTGAVQAARDAERLGNASDFAAQVRAVSDLAGQVTALIHSAVPASAAETVPPLTAPQPS